MTDRFELVALEPAEKPAKKAKKTGQRDDLSAAQFQLADRSRQAWYVEPHLCRRCFGRLLSMPGPDGDRFYRCSNCGHVAKGARSRVMCACGIKIGDRDSGIRCVVNPNPNPETPSEILAKEMR